MLLLVILNIMRGLTPATALQVVQMPVHRSLGGRSIVADKYAKPVAYKNTGLHIHQLAVQDRDGLVPVTLENRNYFYEVDLDLGTPGQFAAFTIDTGSSDLWVMDVNSPFCNSNRSNITVDCTNSTFNAALSKTWSNTSVPFDIAYGDYSTAQGFLGTDRVQLGNVAISNATFAVANSNASTCVFGIGFNQNEANARIHRNGSGVYPVYFNIPTLMKKQGFIKSNAYSLWLNSPNEVAGSILFGGVDHSKYQGTLSIMPINNIYSQYVDQPTQMRVMLNGLSTTSAQNLTVPLARFNISVLLDSGTSFAYLPAPIVAGLGQRFGYVFDDSLGYFFGNCAAANETVKSIVLDFSGADITIPGSDLLVTLNGDDGTTPFNVNGKPQCALALGNSSDPYSFIIGDVFLRSMYAVYNLDSYQIGLAEAQRSPAIDMVDSEVEVIEAGIPGGTLVPRYTQTSTSNATITTFTAFYNLTSKAVQATFRI